MAANDGEIIAAIDGETIAALDRERIGAIAAKISSLYKAEHNCRM